MTPAQKMTFQKIIEYLRPAALAMGAAIIAPMRVPIDNYGRVSLDKKHCEEVL